MARGYSDGRWGDDDFVPTAADREEYEAVKAQVRRESLDEKRQTYQDPKKTKYRCAAIPEDFSPRTYRYLGPKVKELWIKDHQAIRSKNGDAWT